ncbi:hypothetical protein A9239_00835 [Methanosarcina sp. A14]|nr:hypothetical protein A9239_00835 [Methanosarcina sp. A14]
MQAFIASYLFLTTFGKREYLLIRKSAFRFSLNVLHFLTFIKKAIYRVKVIYRVFCKMISRKVAMIDFYILKDAKIKFEG